MKSRRQDGQHTLSGTSLSDTPARQQKCASLRELAPKTKTRTQARAALDNERKESMTTIAQLDTHVEQQHLTRKNKKMKTNEKTGEAKEQSHTRTQKENVNNREQKR